MDVNQIESYRNFWIQKEKYCLGPIDEFIKSRSSQANEYSIYQRGIFYYMPQEIADEALNNEVIDRMKKAGCEIITHQEISYRSDMSRMWKDRKDEFALKPHYTFEHDYGYRIIHQPSNQTIRTSYSNNKRNAVIKKMLEAGVKIIKEDEFVLKRRAGFKYEYDYEIIDASSQKAVFSEYNEIKRRGLIKKLIEDGVKIIDDNELGS